MNFAVIGLGSFGIKRAQSIKNSKLAKLFGIHDTNKVNAEKAKNILDAPILDYDQILEDKSIDVICICTPNKFHKDIIIDSLKSGKNVFCEKPLCMNMREAEEIYKIEKNSKKTLQIGSNHRFFESVMFAKKLVDKELIGEILSFSGRIGHDGERLKDSWFWNKKISGGGTLLDNGCHLIDLSRYFLGDFISGKGITSNSYWKDISVEDTATCSFETQDGKTATIFSSWRLLSGYFFFELNGSKGYINVDGRFDSHGGDKVYWRNFDGGLESKDFSHLKPNSYQLEIENFIKNLQQDKNCSPSAKDGFEIMKMIDFIYNKK
jgi:predicted dehydrogenase